MSVPARLGAFLLVLLGTFGTAYAVGEKLPGHDHAGHSHGPTSLVPPGFENNGYRVVTDGVEVNGSTRVATFHFEMTDGMRVTDLPEVHAARLHVVLVRPDLSGFQHIHPEITDDGSWQVTLAQPGQWHIVFDAAPDGNPVVVSANLDDEVAVESQPLPEPDDDITVAGVRLVRTGLDFYVTAEDGGPATGLQPYLGMAAHLIAVREGDLSYIHLHPTMEMEGMFMFGSALPQPGTYRMFLQFMRNGDVVTAPFTVVQE